MTAGIGTRPPSGFTQGTFLTSAARTGAAVATAVTFGIAPVSTGLCERIMLGGARLARRWWAGTACAIAGYALVSAPQGPGPAGPAHVDIFGIACGVVAGGCFGVYTVSAKHLIRSDVNMRAAVPVTLLLGGAALAPWTLPELPELAGPRSLGLIAWLGPVTVALAYSLYVAGLRHVTAATAGTLSLAEPLVATALGIGILRERPSLPIAAGTLLLLGGLTLVSISWPRLSQSAPASYLVRCARSLAAAANRRTGRRARRWPGQATAPRS